MSAIVAEPNGQIQGWNLQKGEKSFSFNQKGITDVSFQPLNDYCVFGSKDKEWSFYDLTISKLLNKVQTP